MTVNQIIISTLSILGYPVVPIKYTGTEQTYLTFNYEDQRANEFADDTPQSEVSYLQIHLFCPNTFDYLELKRQIKAMLFIAGFTYPSVIDLYEDDTKKHHLVFRCEYETITNLEVE